MPLSSLSFFSSFDVRLVLGVCPPPPSPPPDRIFSTTSFHLEVTAPASSATYNAYTNRKSHPVKKYCHVYTQPNARTCACSGIYRICMRIRMLHVYEYACAYSDEDAYARCISYAYAYAYAYASYVCIYVCFICKRMRMHMRMRVRMRGAYASHARAHTRVHTRTGTHTQKKKSHTFIHRHIPQDIFMAVFFCRCTLVSACFLYIFL